MFDISIAEDGHLLRTYFKETKFMQYALTGSCNAYTVPGGILEKTDLSKHRLGCNFRTHH